MTIQSPNPLVQVLPETAPFSEEQRSWLNGFFAGLLSLDNAGITALSAEENAAVMGEADDGAPWHDPAMELPERMKLADGKPLPRRLFAAMAQQDCGQCG
jgi:sulfite reductase (NADPH) flavoprotein alpha-component